MTLPKAPSWSQFTESYAPWVRELPPGERPKDWLDSSGDADADARPVPNRSLEEVHVRALRLLVDKLERRKYGAPRKDVPITAESSVPAPVTPTPSKKRSYWPAPPPIATAVCGGRGAGNWRLPTMQEWLRLSKGHWSSTVSSPTLHYDAREPAGLNQQRS